MKEINPTGIEESHSELQKKKEIVLGYCFTNLDKKVFAARGTMPSVLAAALTSRLSRAHVFDIRELYWQELVLKDEFGLAHIFENIGEDSIESVLADERARELIKRIVDGFGDDSGREQASGYIFVEDASVLHTMDAFQHPLITGIEASTRFVNWSEKVDGHYRYSTPETLKGSKYEDEFTQAMDGLFETYSNLWEITWNYIESKNPQPDRVSDSAYKIAVRGRVCDNLRKLLPLGINTNFAIHADYRSLSEVIMNLRASELEESRRIADDMADELEKVNPEFIVMVDSQHGKDWTGHKNQERRILQEFARGDENTSVDLTESSSLQSSVDVEVLNKNYFNDLIFGLLKAGGVNGNDGTVLRIAQEKIQSGEALELLKKLGEVRSNRRHKLHTAFERVGLKVLFNGISFGGAKDLNRHRKIMDKPPFDFSGNYGIYIPQDIEEMGGKAERKFIEAHDRALNTSERISQRYPIEARRLKTHGTKTNLEISMGLGEGYWIGELRSIASGDPEYRRFAQMLHEQLESKMPELKHLGSFVDMNQYQVGRIGEAVRADLKGKSKGI